MSTSTSYYRHSFFPKTINAWNNLPATVAESPDLAAVSFRRIEEFLCSPDLDDKFVSTVKTSEYSVQVRDGYFVWDGKDTEPDLKRINLSIRPGQLVAVVGPCAAGKSTLVHCLLGDITKLSGKVIIKGTTSYVSQEAWIQNMTLRDNVLFGQEYNSKRYWKVIEHCALKADLTLLDGGDKTEIGEKGTNISGGQKQRISLARAVYNNSDIYIMDDPLSAVDSNVGKELFNNVIGNSGLLKQKTRLLVTHAVHWLPLVDNIIVMQQGIISETGTYDELMTHNGPFAQFLQQHFNEEPVRQLDDPELQWIRNNMREQVESLTSDGGDGASSDSQSPLRLKHRRQKKKKQRRRLLSSLSVTQSMNAMTSQHMSMTTGYRHALTTTEEIIKEGAVKPRVFVDYMKAMGLVPVLLSLVALLLDQAVTVYSMFWLTYWTEDPFLKNRTNIGMPGYTHTSYTYLVWYAIMGIVQMALMYVSLHLALTSQIQAASVLHRRMLTCVLRSPMSFYNTVPVGRLLNRFSTDIDNIDNRFPESYRVFSISVAGTISAIVSMVISTPAFGYLIAPALVALWLLMMFYLPTLRKMRRLEAVTRSPIFNHFSETLTGASVIRAFRSCTRFVREATHRLDNNSRYSFAVMCGYRWIGTRLELMAIVVLLVGLLISVLSDSMRGANLGLSINYAVQLTFQLNAITWGVAETEMTGVSAERVQEYTTLDSEADWYAGSISPAPNWPTSGSLQFINYSCRYRPELDLVLKGITCHIQHGEKIGVVGRTGAGKSSLALSLFRIIEASYGTILLDGVNIADIGLHTLRAQITILSQDPVLFCGTLRMNVDPLGKHADEDIWTALSWAHLKPFIQREPGGLDYECDEGGQNLSVGQRQLVCLARALLNKTKVLILDEATAAVDMETDLLIQTTIRTQFTDCTIIAVAHRLNTVIDYDRVMVLDQGYLVELGTPRELLKNKDGYFYAMARDAGIIQG